MDRQLGEILHRDREGVVVIRLKAVGLVLKHLGHELAELREIVYKQHRHRGVGLWVHQLKMYFSDDTECPLRPDH